MLTDFHPRDAS